MSDSNTELHANVGESFEVVLYAQTGSTGYGWHLSAMPKGVVLLGMTEAAVPPVRPGSQNRQTFTFVATQKTQGTLSFELLRPWIPTEPADTRNFALTVTSAPNLQADIEKLAGQRRFAANPSFRSHLPPAVPYGFPDPTHAGTVKTPHGPVWPLYGFPVDQLAAGQHHVLESSTNCMVKYGFPGGVGADADTCLLKYGFPVGAEQVGLMYGFPRNEAGCSAPVTVQENPDNCVVKYGFPHGIAADPKDCVLKYGFPIPPAK
jgi:hypothetical protein